jgi:hypothetical protein
MTHVTSATAVVLGRIEVERGRLRSARQAMDVVAASMPEVGLDTRANLVLAIGSTDSELAKLAARSRRGGVNQNRLQNLTKLTKATDRVVREAFALATGTLARDQGLDGGACAEADRLIAELAEIVDDRLARPTVPGDAEFLHRAADVIRRRLPDHGVWDLPVMAHEFGHVLAAHLQLYDPINDQVLNLGNTVLGGWPGYSGTQGEELFCDLLATYAMGPSYACTMLLHRLDPLAAMTPDPAATHPPDAIRAAVVLEVLALLTRGEPDDSRYRMTYGQLSAAWTELQEKAPEKSRLAAEPADGVRTQVRVALDFLDQKLKPLRYDWPRAVIWELAAALKENRPPDPGFDYRIRDVLNAAWRLRLSATPCSPLPAHVEARARILISPERAQGRLARDACNQPRPRPDPGYSP